MSRPIDAEELLKAMDSHDKFGIDPHGYIRRISGDKYGDLVPYVHYKDMIEAVENMPTVEAIPKDQYIKRLKADMVAMLTEIQLKIEEQRQDNPEFNIWKDGYNTANDIDYVIIQQKINELKAESEA